MVSLSTLRTNAYTLMYNHLQTGTYAISTDNIHPSYNDVQVAKEGYPQVIIWEPVISESILTHGISPIRQAVVSYHIQVWEDDAAGVKTVVDEICDKIRTGLSVFRANGLRPVKDEFITESYGQTYSKRRTIHYCDLSVNFRYVEA